MKTTPSDQSPLAALRVLDQLSHLLGLSPQAQVRVLQPQQKLDTHSDWIIGFKDFSGDASLHSEHWERHPRGDEVLCLLSGAVRVLLRADPAQTPLAPHTQELHAGQMLVVPRGGWHRLQVLQPGRLLFITPAQGSEHEKVQA